MSTFLFSKDKTEFLNFCGTDENIKFLEKLFLIFHQIFLYRLENIELDKFKYEHMKVIQINSFQESTSYTIYAIYMSIIQNVESDEILQKYFYLFNSYEKISFSSFITIAQAKIDGFDSLQFGRLLISQDPSEKFSLDARLIDDFSLTQEYYNYMDSCRINI